MALPFYTVFGFRFSVKRLLIIHKLTNWFVAAETEFGISCRRPGKLPVTWPSPETFVKFPR
jgi:hypothetical protein